MLFLAQRYHKVGILRQTTGKPACNILLHSCPLPIAPRLPGNDQAHLAKFGMVRFAIEVPGAGSTKIGRMRAHCQKMRIEGIGNACRNGICRGTGCSTEVAALTSHREGAAILMIEPGKRKRHQGLRFLALVYQWSRESGSPDSLLHWLLA